ncbi:hypothetical protein [Pseudomonas sp. Marseille-Q1929]|uniref:hypothetical protein n=1 Tax=Pseudomonas sp. Marseille-Q1929 TaxID=2730402 RepID=UPI001A8EA128|nr:hypothetical protein [Pseudomonas sp. Marseille-Q1929]MBO0494418.1 hypothetical protein [Pseudomonas sp. Marseille-Q1929]
MSKKIREPFENELLPSPPMRPDPEVSVEDLDDPYVSGAVKPVVDAYAGLGIRHVENYLIVHFERWGSLNLGDIFEFYMSGRYPLAWGEIGEDDIGKSSLQLAIRRELVPLGLVQNCFGRVERRGSGTESTSPKRTMLVIDTRPGGAESVGLPYNDKLKLHLPADLQLPGAILDPERAALGVVFTLDRYLNIRIRDVVQLFWNSDPTKMVELVIDADHVSGIKKIEIFVDGSIIILGGSGLLSHRCCVHDEVFNFSGYHQRYSKALPLEADLDPNLLERPYLLADGVDISEYDHDVYSRSHVQVEVYVDRRLPDGTLTPTGTEIEVTFSGSREDGTSYVVVLDRFPARIGRSTFADVDTDYFKEVIGGSVNFSYKLFFPAATELARSRNVRVPVIGTRAVMPRLFVVENEAGLIDPNLPLITVEFPEYEPYNRNYSVKLVMQAVLVGGGTVEYTETLLAGNPPPPTRFRIVFQHQFERFIGLGDVRMWYEVDDGAIGPLSAGTLTVRKSEELIVQFGERVKEMPEMTVEAVDEDYNLDPDDLVRQARVTLPYMRTAPGDTFVWRLNGSVPGGSTGGEIDINGATAGRAVSFNVDKEVFTTNKNGEMRGTYSLIPGNGGRTLHSEVLIFSVGKALRNLPVPEVIEAEKNPDKLTPEAVLDGATIKVSFIEMLPSDLIMAEWLGVLGSEIDTYRETKNGNTNKTVQFIVPKSVIGASIRQHGSDIVVRYNLIRGTRKLPSPPLHLNLRPLNAPPTPTIQGIPGQTLNPLMLSGEELTEITRWHFINRNQTMRLDHYGVFPDDEPYRESTLDGDLVGEDGERLGIMSRTPVSQIQVLKNNSNYNIEFCVNFAQTDDREDETCFPLRTYTIENTVTTPAITSVRDGSGNALTKTYYTTLSSVRLSGTAEPLSKLEIWTSAIRRDAFDVPSSGNWSRTISGLSKGTYDFQARAVVGNPPPVSNIKRVIVQAIIGKPVITAAYNAAGQYIPPGGYVSHPGTAGGFVRFTGTCTARPYQRTAHIRFPAGGGYGFIINAGRTTWSRDTEGFSQTQNWLDWQVTETEENPQNRSDLYRIVYKQ